MSSSVASSGEHTAQPSFMPSWMRSTFNGSGGGGGGAIGSQRQSEQESYDPIPSKYCYEREDLLALQPKDSSTTPPEGLRTCPFFVEVAQPASVTNPLSDLEQRLQHNINSSKAMSSLSQSDRMAIASGATFAGGYNGGANGGSPAGLNRSNSSGAGGGGWTPVKSAKNTPDRAQRGGGSVRGSGGYIRGRGGMLNLSTDAGNAGSHNSSAPGTPDDTGRTAPFSKYTSSFRRGGGPGAVGRGGSTTATVYNPRAEALYNDNERPKHVGLTKSESAEADDDEGGWSTVGAPQHQQNQQHNHRPAWGRSESWSQRNNTENPWNRNESNTANNQVYNGRAQMLQSVRQSSDEKGNGSEKPPQQPLQQNNQSKSSSPPTQASVEAAIGVQKEPATNSSNSASNSSQLNTDSTTGSQQQFYSPAWPQSQQLAGMGVYDIERLRLAQLQQQQQQQLARQQQQQQQQQKEAENVSFYYIDPTDTRRGPFSKEQMVAWFKCGYFNEESLRVQRGENGEFKTIGKLLMTNGKTTPFDYPEEKNGPAAVPPFGNSILAAVAAAAQQNPAAPMFPSLFGGQSLWGNQAPPADMFGLMQTYEQQMAAERQRMLEDHQRRVKEEADQIQNMVRQMALQQELTQQQLREQENALLRHKEELQRRELEMQEKALEVQKKIEAERIQLEENRRALENERAKKVAEEKMKLERDAAKRREQETAIREKQEAELRKKRAEEAADLERRRLAKEAEAAAERIKAVQKKAEEEAAARKREQDAAVERDRRLAEEWATQEAEAAAAQTVAAKVSPTQSEEGGDGWTPVSKEPVKHTKVAPWAAAKPVEPVATSEKTLREIQLEEERKLKAEQERLAKLRKEEQASNHASLQSAGLWGSSSSRLQWTGSNGAAKPKSGPVWGATAQEASGRPFISPLLDGPSLEAANKVQPAKKPAPAPAPAKPAPKAVAPVKPVAKPAAPKPTKQQQASEALSAWFVKRFKSLSGNSSEIDVPTLLDFVNNLENPNEVEDIVMSYLDESKAVKEFVREFLKRRIEMRNAGGRPDVDDLSSARNVSAAPSDNNAGANSGSGSQGKKKKKSQKTVLDVNVLGFRAAAASDRLNKGEIDAVPTAPVNPSRR